MIILNTKHVCQECRPIKNQLSNIMFVLLTGSTTDLTPTLIGIYDSLLEPKNSGPEVSRFDLTAKDDRNDPPLDPKPPDDSKQEHSTEETMKNMNDQIKIAISPPKEPLKVTEGVKLAGFSSINKSSLYTLRTKVDSAKDSDNHGASNETFDSVKSVLSSSDSTFLHSKSNIYKPNVRGFKNDKVSDITAPPNAFDNLSPNVKRMISSATETSTGIKFQRKPVNAVRSSIRGYKSNIPLVGATSKISQSGVEILPSVEIYDQPCVKTQSEHVENDKSVSSDSPAKIVPLKAEFRLETDHTTYDVPTNKQAIYDVPTHNNKTAFESLSLPYIDQSIELSIASNDREFDTKLSSKDNSPDKSRSPKVSTPERSPSKIPNAVPNCGTNSLHRKDFVNKQDSSDGNTYPDTIGSTGNLKLCAVPEKEERLNPPTVEVSRPLSMSSIASSSSTSSSGVQHKGGVNSAYLASIESLDDNSDADITSAVGSNNFVNNAGISASMSENRRPDGIPRK